MATPVLRLFGTPELATATGRIPFAPARPFQLLAYLGCRGGWAPRDTIASLLWPDRDASNARANLRFVLVQVRRLPYARGVEARADALRWDVASDVRELERAIAAGDWAGAVDAYGGPLLSGFEADAPAPFAEWIAAERARLAAAWHNALDARLAELADDPGTCNALAVRALKSDPLDETAVAAQLAALSALGRDGEARRVYRDYARRLAAELAIEPSAPLREAARRLDASAPVRPAPRTVIAAAPPALVGRRIEFARIGAWLREAEAPVLALVGPGGAGKSALARAAAASVESPPDGVFWIPLDDLATIGEIAARCAGAIGLELRGAGDPADQLRGRLRDARALLVLDNSEHLTGIGGWLAPLVAECPAVKILVTSRARVDLAGARALRLEGLPVPDVDETEVDAVRAFDAVRLFEQRATRALPEFDAVAAAPEVAALVRTLGGLPLVIELAAAWVRVLPVAEIRREIEGSLAILAAGDERVGRAFSVHDSFEHSWRLLAPAEQRALARVAVFAGSFSRESARAVAGAALPLLASLVDKSLVQTADGGRFGLHPLIRQFAHEKLVAGGDDELQATSTRHGEHFLGALARYNDFHAQDQRAAVAVIRAEIENTLAAWRWAVGERRVDLIGACASALESYLDARGESRLGLHLLTDAAAVIDEALPTHQVARCHVELGRAAFCYRRGEFAEGEVAARAALQAARRVRYAFGVKSSTNTLGMMLWRLGRTREAAFCLRDVLRRAREELDVAALPMYAVNLGALELELGNRDAADALVREALEAGRNSGKDQVVHSALNEMCNIALADGRPGDALAHARDGLARCESAGFFRNVPYFRCRLADAYAALGELAAAEAEARAALASIEVSGDRALEPACRCRLADVALTRGDFAQARTELRAAARGARAMRSPRVAAEVLIVFARYCAKRGARDEASSLLELAAAHPATTWRQRSVAAAELEALAVSPSGGPGGGVQPVGAGSLDAALDRVLADAA